MVFSSINFIFYFLPAFLAVYFLVPAKWRNAVLFAASLIFYFYGIREQPIYLLLILLSIVVNYYAAKKIEKERWKRRRKKWLIIGLTYNMAWLFLFKYLDFVIENVNHVSQIVSGKEILGYTHLILPIGISFYTFQISSYLIDVYWKKVKAEKSILTLGTYLCMFPQLIAGPDRYLFFCSKTACKEACIFCKV